MPSEPEMQPAKLLDLNADKPVFCRKVFAAPPLNQVAAGGIAFSIEGL